MKPSSRLWLPLVLMVVFALTRWPGLLPWNFSAAYAIAFCAGVYFRGQLAWWIPLGTLMISDVGLNLYHSKVYGVDAFQPHQIVNYVAFAALIGLGRLFRPGDSWMKLVGGGIGGAILFYLVTNTAAWLFNPFGNPEYTRNIAGWIIALTKGTGGYPQTWEFFRNSLLSGGLFTGLFVGAMQLTARPEPEEAPEGAEESAATEETAPAAEESRA